MEGSGERAKVIVLVVDDDADVRQLFQLYLKKLGPIDLKVCATSKEAVSLLEGGLQPTIAFVDFYIDDVMTGVDVCKFVRSHAPDCLIFSMCGALAEAHDAFPADLHIEAFFEKPFSFARVINRARSALRRHQGAA